MPEIYKKFKEIFPETRLNYSLANESFFKIGGKADLFLGVKDKEKLIRVIKKAIDLDIPYLILGAFSNVLISDKGIKRLVIKNECANFKVKEAKLYVDSGAKLSDVIYRIAKDNLGGLKFLANIPGTFGGAIFGNAGAYGKQIGDFTEEITLLLENGEIKKVDKDFMEFDYRMSILKKGFKAVVLDIVLRLKHRPKEEALEEIIKDKKLRNSKHPIYPSCGSFFKNPSRDNPAGSLIEKAGCKGMCVGGAYVSERHANFLVNKNNASFSDVIKLAEKVKKKVKDKFGIELEEEVRIIK